MRTPDAVRTAPRVERAERRRSTTQAYRRHCLPPEPPPRGQRARSVHSVRDVRMSLTHAIRLRSAVCLLGRFPALAGADLDVGFGEVVLVAGPNGAGKTTLLRLIAGLVPLAGGTAEVLGCDLAADRRSIRRDVALLGHGTGCY